VHLRRALLLFAIVLGMAALAASLSRPVEDRSEPERPAVQAPRDTGPATAAPAPATGPREPVSLDAAKDESRRLRAGSAATVEVSVTEPGSVEIPGLGLSAEADPLTPRASRSSRRDRATTRSSSPRPRATPASRPEGWSSHPPDERAHRRCSGRGLGGLLR
jgi:hypothetical protein